MSATKSGGAGTHHQTATHAVRLHPFEAFVLATAIRGEAERHRTEPGADLETYELMRCRAVDIARAGGCTAAEIAEVAG